MQSCIKIGPSGNSKSFYDEGNKETKQAAQWLADKGLNAFEYSFGRGVNISDAKAVEIGQKMKEFGVEVSVHAPYYINFANPDPVMIEKSIGYVINSAKKIQQFGGRRVIFHPASVGKMTREKALEHTYANMSLLAERIYSENLQHLTFCPESMGKINQIGDYAEVVNLCKIDKVFLPCIDFGHQNARTLGGLKSKDDFVKVFDCMEGGLGDRVKDFHIHFSKIEYSKGGEVRHLTFDDATYGPDFNILAEVLVERKYCPIIICESDGTQAEDAQKMQAIVNALQPEPHTFMPTT